MNTVILDVRAPDEAAQDFVAAWRTGKARKSARNSFATPELLWKVLTAKRWEVLKAMCGAGFGHGARGGAPGRPRRQVGPRGSGGAAEGRRAGPHRGRAGRVPLESIKVSSCQAA